jgi:hypothetical protein
MSSMAIGQLPHGIIIQKIAPRIWFPSMVVVWAGLTVRSYLFLNLELPNLQVSDGKRRS